MKKYLWFLLICFFSDMSLLAQSRIIGGYPVNISQRPYQAAINVNGSFNGGGVIINSEWILTAAHVVRDANNVTYSPNKVTVCTGYTDLLQSYIPVTSVSQIIVHPDYNPSTFTDDIALIKLSSPLTWSVNKQPIIITDVDSYATGTPAVVSGWGLRSTAQGSSSPNQLYAGNITVSSSSAVSFHYKKLISGIAPVAPFYGDSGGPVTISEPSIGDLLIGLVSSGPKNDPTQGYVYYTNVGYYQKWIASNTGNSNSATLKIPQLITRQAASILTNIPANASVSWNIDNTTIASIDNQGVITAKGQGSIKVIALIKMPSGMKMTLHENVNIGIPLLYITLYNNEESYPLPNRTFGANYNYVFVTQTIPGMFTGNMQNYNFDFHWRLVDRYGSVVDSRTIENVWMRVGLFGTKFPSEDTYRLEVDVVAADGTSATYTRTIDVGTPYYISSDVSSNQISVSSKKNGRSSLAGKSGLSIVQLYSSRGLLRNVSFQPENGTIIDISSLSDGFYYLVILEDEVVKQRQTIRVKH